MSGAGFRGVSASQDVRFTDKDKKLMKSMKFPKEYEEKADLRKVKWEVMKPWIAKRVTELLGLEDEVLIAYIYEQLENQTTVDPRLLQISLTGFLEKHTSTFMKELWTMLVSASKNDSGIPQKLLDEKAEELRKKKEIQDQIKVSPAYGQPCCPSNIKVETREEQKGVCCGAEHSFAANNLAEELICVHFYALSESLGRISLLYGPTLGCWQHRRAAGRLMTGLCERREKLEAERRRREEERQEAAKKREEERRAADKAREEQREKEREARAVRDRERGDREKERGGRAEAERGGGGNGRGGGDRDRERDPRRDDRMGDRRRGPSPRRGDRDRSPTLKKGRYDRSRSPANRDRMRHPEASRPLPGPPKRERSASPRLPGPPPRLPPPPERREGREHSRRDRSAERDADMKPSAQPGNGHIKEERASGPAEDRNLKVEPMETEDGVEEGEPGSKDKKRKKEKKEKKDKKEKKEKKEKKAKKERRDREEGGPSATALGGLSPERQGSSPDREAEKRLEEDLRKAALDRMQSM